VAEADDLSGRTCLVTGANSGIGKEIARGLAALRASVVLACRNEPRGEAARDDIVGTTGNPDVAVMLVDLSSQKSIRMFADAFKQKYSRLHVLVNNAGIHYSKRVLTVDGLESTFATNHIGYFLLTNLLLDLLKASAPARIVNIASEAHRGSRIDFDNLRGEKNYGGMQAYSQSKLANILFTYELARRLEGSGVTVNCVHPGVVRTNFGRGTGGYMSLVMRALAPFLRSPKKGAETAIYLASAKSLEHVTGKYFSDLTEKKSSKVSYDIALADQLWKVSDQLTDRTV
jgi:NAD(P)-dependent dehydrogenase (short-subunit alcohol dehydrogenase family)